jgi:hypothetical protein
LFSKPPIVRFDGAPLKRFARDVGEYPYSFHWQGEKSRDGGLRQSTAKNNGALAAQSSSLATTNPVDAITGYYYAMGALWLRGIALEWRRGFSDSEAVRPHADELNEE